MAELEKLLVKKFDITLGMYLEERGVTLEDLVETELALFMPHPGVENE
jgi:hypothetical protein